MIFYSQIIIRRKPMRDRVASSPALGIGSGHTRSFYFGKAGRVIAMRQVYTVSEASCGSN